MRIARFNVIVIALIGLATCQSRPTASPRFFPLSRPETPEPVRVAAAAVYRMLVFPPNSETVVPKTKSELLLKQARERMDGGELSRWSFHLLEILVEDLRDGPEPAKNFGIVGTATAFLCGDATSLWTPRHTLEAFAPPELDVGEFATNAVRLRGTSIQIVLLGHDEKVVFDSRGNGDHATIEDIGTANAPQLVSVENPGIRVLATDFALIRLSRHLAAGPIPVRKARAVVGEAIYIPGYPSTDDATDPVPRGLRYSQGVVLDRPDASRAYGPHVISETDPDYRRLVLISNAGGSPGASGAPMLDRNGRLLAMTTGGISEDGVGLAMGIRWSTITATRGVTLVGEGEGH